MSTQSGNLEEFLTVAEVAETLKLNQQTVRNWIDQGLLPAHRVGRRVRISRSDFDRLLEEGYTSKNDPGSGEPAAGQSSTEAGPTADGFWGGEPVILAEPWDGEAAVDTHRHAASQSGAPDGDNDG